MQQRAGQSPEAQQPQAEAGQQEAARSWGFIVGTFVLFFTGIPGVLARASVYTALIVLCHSSLRQSPSEFAVALQSTGQSSKVPPGVPFLEVNTSCALHSV